MRGVDVQSRKGTLLSVLGLCLGFFLIAFTGVASAQYTDTGQVRPASVGPGEEFVFSGGGFAPGSTVTIFFDGEEVGTELVDAQGNFAGTFIVGCETPAGTYTIEARGADATGGTRTVTATVTITEGECPDGAPRRVEPRGEAQRQVGARQIGGRGAGGGLPVTGQASTAPLVAAGVGLVLIGSVAVATARRRRTGGASGL